MKLWQPRLLSSELSRQPLTRQHAILIPLDPIHLDIGEVLAMLDGIYPNLHYPLYTDVLHMNGVNALVDAVKFSPLFYANIVGMDYSGTYLFCKWVAENGPKLRCIH